ncbi:NAD-dependent epimerase/dehydratase family protein [Actinoplanes sp. NPDC049599]|uniref:NAD-dependent epimerase/dehydratase family protein n=1 Tax=Actinoplanes sp. NPDC049599 TaxID=3363903 RepID=UPI0037B2A404
MVSRVFVSGVAGFLGSHLARHYRDRGAAVAGIDNMLGGNLEHVPAGTRFRAVDCVAPDDYRDLLRGTQVVFHCAAAPYEGLSIFSPTLVYQHTLQSTVALATAAVEAGVTRFVLCSSMARYGNGPAPFTEDLEPAPVDPYGLAKVAAEQLVANLGDRHGMEWAIAAPLAQLAERPAAKARRLLGYAPRWSLEDGLRRTIAYIRSHGPKPFEYHLPIEISSELTPAVWAERLM